MKKTKWHSWIGQTLYLFGCTQPYQEGTKSSFQVVCIFSDQVCIFNPQWVHLNMFDCTWGVILFHLCSGCFLKQESQTNGTKLSMQLLTFMGFIFNVSDIWLIFLPSDMHKMYPCIYQFTQFSESYSFGTVLVQKTWYGIAAFSQS